MISQIHSSSTSAGPSSPPKVTFIPCDLADLSSVRSASEKLLSELTRLDVLICNAGIMVVPPALSKDGYEIHFATNHLGHALLTKKLLPLLQATATATAEAGPGRGDTVRIIMVSSAAWRGTPPGGIVFDKLKTKQEGLPFLGRWLRYGQSKLANMLYARELAKRHPEILSFSLTPGVVATGLVKDSGWADKALVYATTWRAMKTPEEGTHNTLWAVGVDGRDVEPGAFYEPVGKVSKMESKASRDPELGGKLWEWTEGELERWM